MGINKNKIIVMIVAVLICITSFSFAFLIIESGDKTELEIELATIDNKTLIFNKGEELTVSVKSETFGIGAGDAIGKTNPSVTLTSKSEATETYNIFLNIIKNTIIYTTEEKIPELVLNIYDENGEEITNLDGLVYYDQDGIKGFDITEVRDYIYIDFDKEITTTSQTIHEYEFVITFVNLDTNQILNLGNGFSAQVIFDQLDITDYTLTLANTILYDNGGKESIESKNEPDFTTTAITNEGMFHTYDDYGKSYYYRGAVDNNWVIYGQEGGKDIYWRIVRIEGNGNVKMIYTGTTPPTASESVVMTGTKTQINGLTYKFNNLSSSTEYAGYVYEIGDFHGTITDSNAKTEIDNWFNTTLAEEYGELIEKSPYCLNRDTYSDLEGLIPNYSMSSVHYYKGQIYLIGNHPTLKCETTNIFSDILYINSGLVSDNEFMYAGGLSGVYNTNFYLNTSRTQWTISPAYFSNNNAGVLYITGDDKFGAYVTYSYALRPTISLSASSMVIEGDGTYNDPYRIS